MAQPEAKPVEEVELRLQGEFARWIDAEFELVLTDPEGETQSFALCGIQVADLVLDAWQGGMPGAREIRQFWDRARLLGLNDQPPAIQEGTREAWWSGLRRQPRRRPETAPGDP